MPAVRCVEVLRIILCVTGPEVEVENVVGAEERRGRVLLQDGGPASLLPLLICNGFWSRKAVLVWAG